MAIDILSSTCCESCDRGFLARHRGFTLVELVVVLAVIGTLAGILLPAVQQARLAAARGESQNNLRQIGLALSRHADARGALPFASGRPRPGTVPHAEDRPVDGSGAIRPQSWAIVILPYIEEAALAAMYDAYCLACPPESQEEDIVSARIGIYNSASKLPGGVDYAALVGPGPAAPDPAHRLDGWFHATPPTAADFTGMLMPEGLGWLDQQGAYITSIRSKPTRLADAFDGLSNTLLLAECHDYTPDGGATWTQPRYSWPYVCDVARYTRFGAGAGTSPTQTSLKPRSRLPGGVFQTLAGDGGVRPLSEAIAADVLAAVVSRAGGETQPAP